MSFLKPARGTFVVLGIALLAAPLCAQPIASNDLEIRGMALTIDNPSASTVPDTPSYVQTRFGGQIDDAAPVLGDVLVKGDLIGPGISTPITLQTAAGHKFQIPGLSSAGTYFLQNIRLERSGRFLQPAVPSLVSIKVADAFKTEVTVKQLTPDQLRQRGITVDARNYDVYEYTLSVVINGETISIPFPVIIDSRTHEVIPVPRETPFQLPPDKGTTPPRWSPPSTIVLDLAPEEGPGIPAPPNPLDGEPTVRRQPSIPVAIVIPSDFAVLHQFFAVALMVTNGGTGDVKLDSVTANIQPPAELRVAGSKPPVAFGQAITIVDAKTGSRFLIAQAQGSAEWTLEALKSGTYQVDFDIRATFQSPGQPDIPLRATPKAALVVHDPSFNVTFSHPDTVRTGEPYSTFAFITNMGPSAQSLVVDSGVQTCTENPSANVCLDGGQVSTSLDNILPGETRTIEYKLKPNVTGQVFATAAASDGDVIKTGVKLTMGVSATGIPLSPATLVMPYYARFLSESLVRDNMRLLGLGYSLATAPVNQQTARFPRVIRSDVFRRAVDIARAGQRIFISENRDREAALANLALDLLGNGDGNDLTEWDELRRMDGEAAGRVAGAALAREMAAAVPAADRTLQHLFNNLASSTAHRAPYFVALAHGQPVAGVTNPYSIVACPRSATGFCQGQIAVPNEAASGWKRTAAWGDLWALTLTDPNASDPQNAPAIEVGELALVGRADSDFQVEITAEKAGSFTADLIWPGAGATEKLKATIPLTATSDKQKFVLYLRKGEATITGDAIATGTPLPLASLQIAGARQDIHLEEEGHLVSLLFNRPVRIAKDADGKLLDVRGVFKARVSLDKDGVRYDGDRPIYGAALQEDSRVLNLTFEHALSQNATYTLSQDTIVSPTPLLDGANGLPVTFSQTNLKIDNHRPAALLTGQVLGADGLPISGAEVTLRYTSTGRLNTPQVDVSDASGKYFYEYVPLDPNDGYPGTYRLEGVANINGTNKRTVVDGAVREPQHVYYVNLSFLGRGIAEGHVRYDDGTVVSDARVIVGSTMFGSSRETRTDGSGSYRVSDLPVGPLTFSAIDSTGNVAYAANELKSGGQTITRNSSPRPVWCCCVS